MRFTLDYPISSAAFDPALLTPQGMTRVVAAAEAAGFDAVGFTEHPAPSQTWLEGGGHATLDLTTALAFCAATTRRIRLMTYLMVLPYRNPFLSAKALATVDILSSGRCTVVAGTGYLRSEFGALGVDFDERNELFDEALQVMQQVWTAHPVEFTGKHFQARAVSAVPLPVQRGGPPVWVGGNSALSRRRAARLQGWSPLMVDELTAKTTRTPALTTVEQLAEHVDQILAARHEAGVGDEPFDVQVHGPQSSWLRGGASAESHLEHVGALAEAGATWFVIQPAVDSMESTVESLERYGELIISRLQLG